MIHDNNAAVGTPIGAGSLAGVPSLVATPGPSSRQVLVVEDDPAVCRLLVMALLGEGYRVTCVGDGEQGWDALCGSSFDGMVTDHDMPRLTGLELIRRVRAGPSRLPIILISGKMPSPAEELDRLLAPGIAIEKPFELRTFLATVRDTIGGPHYSDLPRGDAGGIRSAGRPPTTADGLLRRAPGRSPPSRATPT